MEEGKESEGFDSSDEGFGGEESECEEGECEEEEEEEEEEMETDTDPRNHSLADSGYSQLDTPPTPLSLDARYVSYIELQGLALFPGSVLRFALTDVGGWLGKNGKGLVLSIT